MGGSPTSKSPFLSLITISEVSESASTSNRNVSAEVDVELVVGLLLKCWWKRLRRTPVGLELDPDACRVSAIEAYYNLLVMCLHLAGLGSDVFVDVASAFASAGSPSETWGSSLWGLNFQLSMLHGVQFSTSFMTCERNRATACFLENYEQASIRHTTFGEMVWYISSHQTAQGR